MRIWIKDYNEKFVELHKCNPIGGYPSYYVLFCRKFIRKLLEGSGICLPRLNSNQVVEVEITACRPKTAKRRRT